MAKKKNPAAVALGQIRSAKKAAAARENGKKGGRPRLSKSARLSKIVKDWSPLLESLATGGRPRKDRP